MHWNYGVLYQRVVALLVAKTVLEHTEVLYEDGGANMVIVVIVLPGWT
jgi:hypothetical protein